MNKRLTGTVVNMNKLDRPSLYEAGAAGSSDAQFSILEALEPRRGKLRDYRGRVLGTALVIGAVLVIFVNPAWRNGSLSSAWKGESSQPAPVPKAVESMPGLASTQMRDTESSPALSDAQHALARVDDVLEPPAPTLATAIAVNPGQENEASAPKTTVPDPKSVQAPLKKGRVERKEIVKTKQHDSKSKTKLASSKGKSKDKDVELIAALLSHVSRPAPGSTQPSPGRAETASTQHGGAVSVAPGRVRANDRSSEVVVRGAEDSTESLVKRCKTLGFIEGELCRVRICSGLWSKDPACPTSADKAGNAH
ncbi:hypothetical protein [Noviherbaspirillum sp.]|uniref:hypothetical protein n=1 Tax=Noviherbaspirillum sp. TaxID=1926288 RepID=UPI002B4665F1|nr:hypothetical protein [Noviherbaspirillum sp.]HJV82755.1 hypothetical protein [Noviherbaspirillum sp.]